MMIPKSDKVISVFKISNEPIVISKGNYGESIIIELSFSHEGLEDWIQHLDKPYPLFMLEADWIERSPEIIRQLQKNNIPTGLYGKSEYSFKQELSIYEKHFKSKPLWYMTSNYEYSEELKKAALRENVNLLSPTFIYSEKETPLKTKGAIIAIPLHESSTPNFSSISKFIDSREFISIEENIFGFTMKSKKLP